MAPDLKVTSGTAGVSESDNPLTLDQLWNPADVDPTALFDFLQLPGKDSCNPLPSGSGKGCFWSGDPNNHAAIMILHTFSTKVSYDDMKRRSNFHNFRPASVGGYPATFYTLTGGSENNVCNLGWGTPTGTTWVSVQQSRIESGLTNMCGVTQNWANSVYPYTRINRPKATPGVPWRPDTLNSGAFLGRHSLIRDQGADGPTGCATFGESIRSCIWRPDTEKIGTRGEYEVRVTSSTAPYDEFSRRRTTDYADHQQVTVMGAPALQYSAMPTTCNVAWASRTGTAWVRVSLNSASPKEFRDTCSVARKIAIDAQLISVAS